MHGHRQQPRRRVRLDLRVRVGPRVRIGLLVRVGPRVRVGRLLLVGQRVRVGRRVRVGGWVQPVHPGLLFSAAGQPDHRRGHRRVGGVGRRLVRRFGRPSAARRPDRLVGGRPGVRHRPGVVGCGCLRVVAGFGRPVAVRWDAGGRHDRCVPSCGRVVGAGVVGTGGRPGQGRHLGGQRVVGGQVLAAQLTGERQVVVCLGELPTVALHRPEPRQHLDAAGVPVAVHLAVQLPGVLEAVAGHSALAARVLDGGQVGVRGEHPQ
ncbi:hypothetical protein GUI43_01304 [Micromonospora noduli]|nr:hypothetical protein GUI43_01304 [Micromonospora noduli]